jgi:hypothetical protein
MLAIADTSCLLPARFRLARKGPEWVPTPINYAPGIPLLRAQQFRAQLFRMQSANNLFPAGYL